MRYKNNETGAVIDSPFKITGDNWVEWTSKEKEKLYNQIGEEITGKEEVPTEEYVEEEVEVDLEEMTNKELEAFAKEHKIELTSNDKRNKPSLITAIAKAFE